jgi:hypothetical protein
VSRHLTIVSLLAASLAAASLAAPPNVVTTSPDNGEIDVDPGVREIHVEFDQPMDPRGRSVVGGGDSFPQIAGELRWANDRTFIIPVTLRPNHEYQLSINTDTFKGFTGKGGQPAEWYPLRFRTRAAGAPPAAPDVTPEQNRAALTALTAAIDHDYAYRDRRKINWAKEIAARGAAFESSRTSNGFARQTAHLLRLAEDAHVSVKAGDVHLATRTNSAPPNFDLRLLRRVVPDWTEHPGGVVAGRFDPEAGGGIGYVSIYFIL